MEIKANRYETAVVDTNIFLKMIDIRCLTSSITVTPEMMAELKDPQVRSFFASYPVPYKVKEASRESLAAVMDAATLLGDLHVLSKADISLIAAARDAAIEAGDGDLLKTPSLKDTASMKKQRRKRNRAQGLPARDFSPVIRDMMMKEAGEKKAKIEEETGGWVVAGERKQKRGRRGRGKPIGVEAPEGDTNKDAIPTASTATEDTKETEQQKTATVEEPEETNSLAATTDATDASGVPEATEDGKGGDQVPKKPNKKRARKQRGGPLSDPFSVNGMDGGWITEETVNEEVAMKSQGVVVMNQETNAPESNTEKDKDCERGKGGEQREEDRQPKTILLTLDTPMQNTAVALGLRVVVPLCCYADDREKPRRLEDYVAVKSCRANRICCKVCFHVFNPTEFPKVCPTCGTERTFARVWANISADGQIYGISREAIQAARTININDKQVDWYHRPGLGTLSGSDWFQQEFAGPTTIRHTNREFSLPKAQQRQFQSIDASHIVVGERIKRE